MTKPLVAIFSDSNFFSIHLVESLLSKSCDIIVVAADKKAWLQKTMHITNRKNLYISDIKEFRTDTPISYAVFCNGFADPKGAYNDFRLLYTTGVFKNIKSIAIFPKDAFDFQEDESLPASGNLAVVYLGDLVSPRMSREEDLRMTRIVSEVMDRRSVTFGVGEVLDPTFAPDAAKVISKWIFSFGPYGKEVFLAGTEVSASEFWKKVNETLPGIDIHYDKNLNTKRIPRSLGREVINTNLAYCLKETLRGMIVRPRVAKAVLKPKRKLSKGKKVAIASVLAFLIFPILSLLVSGILTLFSLKIYSLGRVDAARGLIYISSATAKIARVESDLLKRIPMVGLFYREVNYALYLNDRITDLFLDAIPVAEASKDLTGKVLGNEIYDPQSITSGLKLPLERIYNSMSLIEAETKARAVQGEIVAGKVQSEVDFLKIKSLALSGSKITEDLPQILGKDGRKTYLVLFQNNTELRPTGGFIGSFALLTLEGGRMTDFSVSDVYSADGQLKGHIEPPAPIRQYLKEANWFLRDSNWDPDFPTSAKRAEWFIDKEIDRQVDGVLAVDLHPVKDLVEIVGPVYLPDYEMDITSENLYEKTQAEVHEDFFPGTHKKASFLTALSRNLVSALGGLDGSQKLEVLRSAYKNLEERHIQLYLHSENTQNQISQLGWAGEVRASDCGPGCYSDFLGLVEANVGVNKANYFVARNQDLAIDFGNGQINRELTISFINSANPGLGAPAVYKSYVRVLVPADSIPAGDFEVTETRGFKEMGFVVEVLAGQTKQYKVSWSSPAADYQKYGVYVRKQAGTQEGDKLSVAMDGTLVYNSNLTKDIWIQKP